MRDERAAHRSWNAFVNQISGQPRIASRRSPMNLLFAMSEFAGLSKAGGLGDVSTGLPRAAMPRHRRAC
jgi:hypothetical protein